MENYFVFKVDEDGRILHVRSFGTREAASEFCRGRMCHFYSCFVPKGALI